MRPWPDQRYPPGGSCWVIDVWCESRGVGLVIAMGVLPPSDPEPPGVALPARPAATTTPSAGMPSKRALEPDARVADVAGELGVSASTLRRWVKAAGDADGSAATAAAAQRGDRPSRSQPRDTGTPTPWPSRMRRRPCRQVGAAGGHAGAVAGAERQLASRGAGVRHLTAAPALAAHRSPCPPSRPGRPLPPLPRARRAAGRARRTPRARDARRDPRDVPAHPAGCPSRPT